MKSMHLMHDPMHSCFCGKDSVRFIFSFISLTLFLSLQALDGLKSLKNTKDLNSFIKTQNNMEVLSRIVQEAGKLEVFDNIHAATAVTRAGHLLKEEKSLTKSISTDSTRQFSAIVVQVARPFIGEMKEQALGNFIWALGCFGRPLATAADKEILEELLDASRMNLDTFKPQNVSNTAWSLAVLEHDDPVFMAELLTAARPMLRAFIPQALSNLIYALAKQKQRGAPDPRGLDVFLKEFVRSAMEQLSDFSAQALSNTAWSLATMGCDEPDFMEQLLTAAMPRLHDFLPQNLSNFVYALAKQKQRGAPDPRGLDAFMKELVQSAAEQLHGFKPQELSNTAWAMANVGHDDPIFMAKLLVAATPMLGKFTTQNLSNLVYALAKQKLQRQSNGVPDPRGLDLFLKEFAISACAKLGTFTTQDLCNTSWALVNLGYRDLNFQRRARATIESREQMFGHRDRVNLKMWLDKLA